MAQQLHKRFSDDQVKELLRRYLQQEIGRSYVQEILGIKRRRFCLLVQQYRANPATFSVRYQRKTKPRTIPAGIERNIIKELAIDKQLIEDKDVPLKRYNYSYVQTRLATVYHQQVSLPTIIKRAKEHGFYLKKGPKKTPHDREVITNYVGELIQHDASHHLWAPLAREKWYLITSLDDYSRFMLYATLLRQETTWAHIYALQTVFLRYGLPYSYYVDSHRIFRFVQGRDSFWRRHYLFTDDVCTQWKQVMNDCGVKVIPALSPQAKGKVERPYGWLQDRLIRTCVREDVSDIRQARQENKTLFREFADRPPFVSAKDIFCFRIRRIIDNYRKISLHNLQLRVQDAIPRETVELRIYPLNHDLCEIRFWLRSKLVDVQTVKSADLPGVHVKSLKCALLKFS